MDPSFLTSLGKTGMNTSVQLANQAVADLMDTIGSKDFDMFKQRSSASTMPILKYGGYIRKMMNGGTLPVNVEGQEMITSPYNQKGMKVNGKAHSQGGVNLDLPQGSSVFSKKLKLEGKSFAKRKESRDRQLTRSEKANKKYNKIDSFTLDRMQSNNQKMDEIDLFVQDLLSQSKGFKNGKRLKAEFGYNGTDPLIGPRKPLYLEPLPQSQAQSSIGDLVGDYKIPSINQTQEPGFFDQLFNSSITQNQRGNIAQQIGSFAPAAMTSANRAGDTPNINPYKNVGADALSLMQNARRSQAASGKGVGEEIDARYAASRNNINQNSGSINQLRNLNFVNDSANAREKARTNMQIIGQLGQTDANIGQMQMQASSLEAQGEQMRDTANRQDRDAFYTNFGKDIQSATTGQMIGARNMNEEAYQEEIENLIENYKNKRIDYVTFQTKMASIFKSLGISYEQPKAKEK